MVRKKIRCLYGYYEHIKSVHYDRVLKYKPYAQAGVIVDGPFNDGFILVSYESEILRIANGTIEFYNTEPDYSRSTIGHVIAFLKEYAPKISYQQVKKAYHTDPLQAWEIVGNELIHPETGEVI